jgi:hypothetical protein
MCKSLIFSIANRFGRTYSGSCVFHFVEFLNQVYCWDANSFVRIMFWFIDGSCFAELQLNNPRVQLFGFASASSHNNSTAPSTSLEVSSSSLCPEPAAEAVPTDTNEAPGTSAGTSPPTPPISADSPAPAPQTTDAGAPASPGPPPALQQAWARRSRRRCWPRGRPPAIAAPGGGELMHTSLETWCTGHAGADSIKLNRDAAASRTSRKPDRIIRRINIRISMDKNG